MYPERRFVTTQGANLKLAAEGIRLSVQK